MPTGDAYSSGHLVPSLCFVCGRRRVAVARYRMICLVLAYVLLVETSPFSELVIFKDYAFRISLGTFLILTPHYANSRQEEVHWRDPLMVACWCSDGHIEESFLMYNALEPHRRSTFLCGPPTWHFRSLKYSRLWRNGPQRKHSCNTLSIDIIVLFFIFVLFLSLSFICKQRLQL